MGGNFSSGFSLACDGNTVCDVQQGFLQVYLRRSLEDRAKAITMAEMLWSAGL